MFPVPFWKVFWIRTELAACPLITYPEASQREFEFRLFHAECEWHEAHCVWMIEKAAAKLGSPPVSKTASV
jgi:hypothetical protein